MNFFRYQESIVHVFNQVQQLVVRADKFVKFSTFSLKFSWALCDFEICSYAEKVHWCLRR